MTSRSERSHIREVLGNLMAFDDEEVCLGIYLDNGDEYYYRRTGHQWVRLSESPKASAVGCGFAILVENFIFGFGSKTCIYIVIDTDTYPGDTFDFSCTKIELREEEIDVMFG